MVRGVRALPRSLWANRETPFGGLAPAVGACNRSIAHLLAALDHVRDHGVTIGHDLGLPVARLIPLAFDLREPSGPPRTGAVQFGARIVFATCA